MRAFQKTLNIELLIGVTVALMIMATAPLLVVSNVEGAFSQADITASVALEEGIKKLDDLSFGRFIIQSGNNAWLRILPSTDSSTNRQAGSSIILTGGNWRPAIFEVTGGFNQPFSIEFPDEVIITHVNFPNTQDNRYRMTVSEFTTNLPDDAGELDDTGKAIIYVGAFLEGIHPNQYEGRYVGEFTVTAHFE